MKRTPPEVSAVEVSPNGPPKNQPSSQSRRKFLGRVGMASVAAGVMGSVPKAFGSLAKPLVSTTGANLTGSQSNRVVAATALRLARAAADSKVPVPPHTISGDELRYADKSASYSKGLLQRDVGLVDLNAWESFKIALISGKNSDWEAVINGGPRTHNGPQSSYAFDMEGLDSSQFGNAPSPNDPTGLPVVPPFFKVTSQEYGAQLVEMYWASLLRDVAFTDYGSNSTAQAAAAELDKLPGYQGPRDSTGHVTTDTLFRGVFPGELTGPYMSQLMITPTTFGQQAMSQQMTTFLPGLDYVTSYSDYLTVSSGGSTGQSLQTDSIPRYLHDGRGLGAWTHADVLYQGYLVAMLVLGTLKAPVNPGNPYLGSKTQNGFATFGGPDFAACMGECAAKALNRVWYQKWLVHLTHRPEAGGAVCHQNITSPGKLQAKLNSNVLNSKAVQQTFSKYGTYFLAQAFPEGSPTHPCYPTGHGTVAGAAITFLKFFFDENYVLPNPQVPTDDGLALVPYTGSDAGQITVGGELNKLASNISFGHGIHAGIHWRYSTYASILLGEALAISMLQDKAPCYHEKFTISFTKLDGDKVTVTNQ